MPVIDNCINNFKFTKIFSFIKKENKRKQIATIKNLNDRAAKGLADCTINWPLTNAELHKIMNDNGR